MMSVVSFRAEQQARNSVTSEDAPYANKVIFAKMPTGAIFDKRVRATELRVIAAIASYADKEGYAWPSVLTLAKRLGVSRQAVQKQIKKAVEHGYIQIARRAKPSGEHQSNLYRVIFYYPQDDDNQSVDASDMDDCNHPSDKAGESVSDDWEPF